MAAAVTSTVVIDESVLRAHARLSVGRVLIVAVLLAVELAIVVWPLPLHVAQSVSGHWDSFFGVWRLAWIADAIRTPGVRLFDAPIFHPHGLTLAFSDAMLVPSLLAAPLRYAGLTPVLTFNVVLAAAFLTSGLALFALVRRLTGSLEAGLVSATIYTLAPYRLDHLDHLEMQAAAFMPAGLWLWHRAVDRQSAAAAAGAVSMAVLQWLSAIYYGMLFAPYALVMCRHRMGAGFPAPPGAHPLAHGDRRRRRRAGRGLVLEALSRQPCRHRRSRRPRSLRSTAPRRSAISPCTRATPSTEACSRHSAARRRDCSRACWRWCWQASGWHEPRGRRRKWAYVAGRRRRIRSLARHQRSAGAASCGRSCCPIAAYAHRRVPASWCS